MSGHPPYSDPSEDASELFKAKVSAEVIFAKLFGLVRRVEDAVVRIEAMYPPAVLRSILDGVAPLDAAPEDVRAARPPFDFVAVEGAPFLRVGGKREKLIAIHWPDRLDPETYRAVCEFHTDWGRDHPELRICIVRESGAIELRAENGLAVYVESPEGAPWPYVRNGAELQGVTSWDAADKAWAVR